MRTEVVVASERVETDRKERQAVVDAQVARGEMEAVTTSSGEVLYVCQSPEE